MKYKELKKENKNLINKIPGEYKVKLEYLGEYLDAADISLYEIEIIKNDLLNMILDAINRGESPNEIFNESFEKFSEDIVKNTKKISLAEKIREMIYNVRYFLYLILILSTYFSFKDMGINSVFKSYTEHNVVSIFLIIVLIIFVYFYNRKFKRNIFSNYRYRKIEQQYNILTMAYILLSIWAERNLTFKEFLIPSKLTVFIYLILLIIIIYCTFSIENKKR
ncbi:MAG: hypothetical protein WAO56_05995 [Miniphocaeibacter sp.]|uniref:hypothetical protein n=1 Tax=Miniphocaeibacter sp. TaxID=3100973 RepID=UPI00180BAEE4|nr:hypothetical protein [Gallicola sp.]